MSSGKCQPFCRGLNELKKNIVLKKIIIQWLIFQRSLCIEEEMLLLNINCQSWEFMMFRNKSGMLVRS